MHDVADDLDVPTFYSLCLQLPETHEWEIHTPTVKAQKYWITNVSSILGLFLWLLHFLMLDRLQETKPFIIYKNNL